MIVSPVSNLRGLAQLVGDGDRGFRIFHEILETMIPFPKVLQGVIIWSQGRILHFLSGYRKFEFASITYNKKSYYIDKRFEISNLDLIRDMERIINLKDVL